MAEQNNAAFIWSIGKLLRGSYKQADYGKVILPYTVMRRLDCALEATKASVMSAFEKSANTSGLDFKLQHASGFVFYNTSRFTMKSLLGDPSNLRANLADYLGGFSANVRRIFELYEFEKQISKLDDKDLLYLVTEKFCAVDLGPNSLSNREMGLIFEELIRQFAEASNETAGEHFTPRDVVKLAVAMLFANDDQALAIPGTIRSIYDPTAGTGGMLSSAEEHILNLNPDSALALYGQELNDESFAIATADMLIKGQDAHNLVHGNTLTEDGHAQKTFDYCISNPPFGTNWEAERPSVTKERNTLGFDGRFGPGLPDVSDGSLLFVLHMIKKLRAPSDGGGRIAVILSSSAFYNGDAGSGFSEIRKYLLESDLVETIVGLPDSLFYNTGIPIYLWILDNNKSIERRGKVQLIDASQKYDRVRQALGQKRKELSEAHLQEVLSLYESFESGPHSRIFSNSDFGYQVRKFRTPISGIARNGSDAIDAELVGFLGKGLTLAQIQEAILSNAKTKGLKITKKQALDRALQCFKPGRGGEVLLDMAGKKIYLKGSVFEESIPLGADWGQHYQAFVKPYSPEAEYADEDVRTGYEILWARIFARKKMDKSLKNLETEMSRYLSQFAKLLGESNVR